MRSAIFLSAALLSISGCAVLDQIGPQAAPTGAVTPVTWKTETSFDQRLADQDECVFAAVGLTPSASEDELIRRQENITDEQNIAAINRCLAGKGYQVANVRVCNSEDLSSGTFVTGSTVDNLPPLSRVRCVSPNEGGFVVV